MDHTQACQSFPSRYDQRSIAPQHVDKVFDLRDERLFEVDASTPGDGSRETDRVLMQVCIQREWRIMKTDLHESGFRRCPVHPTAGTIEVISVRKLPVATQTSFYPKTEVVPQKKSTVCCHPAHGVIFILDALRYAKPPREQIEHVRPDIEKNTSLRSIEERWRSRRPTKWATLETRDAP